MKKIILIVLISSMILFGISVCNKESKEKDKPTNNINVSEKLDTIINEGPEISSIPFDYIKTNQKIYDELLDNPKETFEYAIKDLIETNAGNGLKSYLEALSCLEINKNFQYDFESANDFLEHYKEFLMDKNNNFNEYDKYALKLLNKVG